MLLSPCRFAQGKSGNGNKWKHLGLFVSICFHSSLTDWKSLETLCARTARISTSRSSISDVDFLALALLCSINRELVIVSRSFFVIVSKPFEANCLAFHAVDSCSAEYPGQPVG